MAPQSTACAILFADIVGSTQLYEQLGDVCARQRVSKCLDTIAQGVRRMGGHVIKTIGDEVMCTFPDASTATEAACSIQEVLASGTGCLPVKVGFHYGPVLLEKGDIFGDAVNVAARMLGKAKSGEIVTTKATVDELPHHLKMRTRFIDHAFVRGKQHIIEVHEVLWQREAELTIMRKVDSDAASSVRALTLLFFDKSLRLDDSHRVAVLGRDPKSDVLINNELVSRQHARIEWRRMAFVLIDQSTNGTFVRNEYGQESSLHRDEMPLRGSGVIGLGCIPDNASPWVVRYSVE